MPRKVRRYKIVCISKDHPFYPMTHRGVVYEHRLVMAEQVGRVLMGSELVFHIDGNPFNNLPDNLTLVRRRAELASAERIRDAIGVKKVQVPQFLMSANYAIGKKFEHYVSQKLLNLGLPVEDISNLPWRENYHSPFDLKIAFPDKLVFVDVKYRSDISYFMIAVLRLESQMTYEEAGEKMIVICAQLEDGSILERVLPMQTLKEEGYIDECRGIDFYILLEDRLRDLPDISSWVKANGIVST